MEWISRGQGIANPVKSYVVQVFVEILAACLKGADDLVLSGIHVSGAGFVLRQRRICLRASNKTLCITNSSV